MAPKHGPLTKLWIQWKSSRAVPWRQRWLVAQWIQWLRHTRDAPPSIQEQQMDIVRQAQMKQLAAQADAKWASKAARIDMPQRQEIASAALPRRPPEVPLEVTEPVASMDEMMKETEGQSAIVAETAKEEKTAVSKRERKDTTPYTGLKLGKEGEQAPESWAPRPARRR
ncbi:NADH-ubiquinone oxidoreductase assembly factor N7BML [Venturia nashicola]|nr:NADH-ubiquinone oxidoreductase assembly factor N7BML [Venturia nashicola]